MTFCESEYKYAKELLRDILNRREEDRELFDNIPAWRTSALYWYFLTKEEEFLAKAQVFRELADKI